MPDIRPEQNEEEPTVLSAYRQLAPRYHALIDKKPHNAYYDRPAVLSLLPDVRGLRVLDAGCGVGPYSQWLVEHGASVVAIDASPDMLTYARQRLGDRADIRQHDLAQPLDFLSDGSIDLVVSALVLDYLEDWLPTLGEFYRALKPGGLLVFSAGHPLDDYLLNEPENYFKTERVVELWAFGSPDARVPVPRYRRSFESLINPVIDAGFILERFHEHKPTAEYAQVDPEEYEKLSRQPGFCALRARK
nr:class I SAM-dependent methyltransferase [Anaerolineae bacterium]